MPGPQQRPGHKIPEPQPCNYKRTHETPKESNLEHKDEAPPSIDSESATASRHFNPALSYHTSEPANPPTIQQGAPIPQPGLDNATIGPIIIADDESIANVFCFGAFADIIT